MPHPDYVPQLIERAINVGGGVTNKISKAWRRLPRLSFGAERSLLHVAQRFTARVCEQAIERGAEMSHVKSNRCGAARPGPDLIRGDVRDDLLEFIARLDECVCDGHQHRIDAFDRSAHPGFRLGRGGHRESVHVHEVISIAACRSALVLPSASEKP